MDLEVALAFLNLNISPHPQLVAGDTLKAFHVG